MQDNRFGYLDDQHREHVITTSKTPPDSYEGRQHKESASIFYNNIPWTISDKTILGRSDRTWEYSHTICPSYTEEHSALHKVPPYVCRQIVVGSDASRLGEGKNNRLTGTADRMWYVIMQFIPVIKPPYEGLEIAPCIPAGWRGASAKRRFHVSESPISLKSPNGVCKGVKSMTVDGQSIEGDEIIPAHSLIHLTY